MYQSLKLIGGIACVLAIVFIFGCSGGTEVGNPIQPPGSIAPTAEQELEDYLKEQYATSVLDNDAYYMEAMTFEDAVAEVAAGAAPAPNDSAADFSRTNVQEQGVDESDQVKTDGTYLYVAGQRKINIVKAIPPDAMGLVGTIYISGYVEALYLYNDILVVLHTPDDSEAGTWTGTDLTGRADVGMPYWLPVKAEIGVMLVDISDPSTPNRISEVRADGSLVSSRLTGGKLHIVQQYLPDLPPLTLYYEDTDENRDAAISANRQTLEPLTLDDLTPGYETVDQDGHTIDSGRLVATEDFYQPEDPAGGSTVTLMTFDMNDLAQPFQSMAIIADVHLIYASTESLYTIATYWDSSAEAIGDFDQHQQTIIHKFDLSGEKITSLGNGRVQGRVLNQFSLGEYEYEGEGVLRIATTTGNNWWAGTSSSNHVYCLKETDGHLEIIGKVEGLAPGETLYSARFIGTRGFLVTFVRIDPLFTLDLSDPADPKVVGELKVPGYSDYIHPLGESHLLTIGKDTKEQDGFTLIQGVQLSVFDITDFANPALLYKEIIGDRGTGSEALYNHKAFTFWAEEGLLAIPIQLYEEAPDNPWDWGSHTFSGLYVYRTTVSSGFELLGRIDTNSSVYTYPDWTRGIFIDTSVYAVKSDAVRAAGIDDIENTVKELALP